MGLKHPSGEDWFDTLAELRRMADDDPEWDEVADVLERHVTPKPRPRVARHEDGEHAALPAAE